MVGFVRYLVGHYQVCTSFTRLVCCALYTYHDGTLNHLSTEKQLYFVCFQRRCLHNSRSTSPTSSGRVFDEKFVKRASWRSSEGGQGEGWFLFTIYCTYTIPVTSSYCFVVIARPRAMCVYSSCGKTIQSAWQRVEKYK